MEATTISKARPAQPALDYQLLRREGLKHIEALAGRLWSDYNLHDPGITTLELLCYALTELGYRTGYPLPDLLAGGGNGPVRLQEQFWTAAQVLPSRPVTLADYRKLLIDIEGVRNAWLKPAPLESYYLDCAASRLERQPVAGDSLTVSPRGAYDVTLEFAEGIDAAGQSALIDIAKKILHDNRNLCEDFREVRTVEPECFIICAEIDLAADADVAAVEAAIFHETQNYLTPPLRFYTLEELLKRGRPTERIFAGPLLANGFIDDEELARAELRSEIRLSDLIGIIMDIEGVVGIKDIRVAPAGGDGASAPAAAERWQIPVGEGRQPLWSLSGSRLVFYKQTLPFRAPAAEVRERYDQLRREQQQQGDSVWSEDLPLPQGRDRGVARYRQLEDHFPRTYGIGPAGLPASVDDRRRAQARQLKAYLLFFDQLLANYLAQLAQLPQLFSMSDAVGRSYFTQVLDGDPALTELYGDYAGLAAALDGLAEDAQLFHQRRNRFLDHLLARFGESFNEYAWLLYSQGYSRTAADLIKTKTDFLGSYPEISCGRGGAFNFSDPRRQWNSDNVSGLERRLARLLGIKNFRRRNLASIKYDIYEEHDQDNVSEFRFRVVDDLGKILLSSSTKYAQPQQALEEMRLALTRAMFREGYETKSTSDGRFYFNITSPGGEVLARRIEYFVGEAALDEAIAYLIDFIARKYSDEGMFVVEHLLLQPRRQGDAFLPVCVGGDCAGAEDPDPYSFRVSVILPAWSPRFARMEFRRFVERNIRQELPAHILPRICWVSQAQMTEFEAAYRRWLECQAGVLEGAEHCNEVNPLNALIDILSRLKNVYPPGTLGDCPLGEGETPIILGESNV